MNDFFNNKPSDYELRRFNDLMQQRQLQDMHDSNMRSYLNWVEGLDRSDALAEEYMRIHGKYPTGYSREANDRRREQAYTAHFSPVETQSSGIGEMIVGGIIVGTAIGAIANYWDTITSAVKTAAQFTLMFGAGAVGGIAVAAGSHKLSSWAWKKASGEEQPVKAGVTAVALFAAVAGGVYTMIDGSFSDQQRVATPATARLVDDGLPRATNKPPIMDEIPKGLYSGKYRESYVHAFVNDRYRGSSYITEQNCVKIISAEAGQEFARIVELKSDDGTSEQKLYARKNELFPAPDCKLP